MWDPTGGVPSQAALALIQTFTNRCNIMPLHQLNYGISLFIVSYTPSINILAGELTKYHLRCPTNMSLVAGCAGQSVIYEKLLQALQT